MKEVSQVFQRLILRVFAGSIAAVSAVAPAATSNSPPGTKLWEFVAEAVITPPAVGQDGTVYFVGDNPNPKLYALTPDGVKKWGRDVGPHLGGPPAIAADGTIY